MPADIDYQAGTLAAEPNATQPIDEKKPLGHESVDRAVGEVEVYEGLPTEDELEGENALRRVSAPIPWTVYTVAFVELCERFSYYGTQVVFSNFINRPLPNGSLPGSNPKTGAGGPSDQGISGALGKGTATANGINTFNALWIYTTPLLGAYMADEHWGRYKAICVSIGIAIIGHIVLVVSAVPTVITNTNAAMGTFMTGIIIMGLGTGGFKPNISTLIVEQIPVTTLIVKTLPSGERVITDPTITQSRIYHYFYLFINIGSLIGQISMVYAEKYVGFWLAFLLPTLIFLLTPGIMFWGRKRYSQAAPEGSVVSKAFKILVLAQRGRWSFNPVRTWKLMHDGTFWASVKPSAIAPENRPSWMTFDDQWVDEVRRGFAACAVFAWYPLYWITYNQIINNLTTQAGTMELHGLPSDILTNLDPLALVILIPLCDQLLYPALRKAGIRFTPIKKITAGFFFGTAAMIWSAVLQHYIYQRSPCGYNANTCYTDSGAPLPATINVWAQTGAYVLIAISEILASITSLEYAFSKAPRNMRSLVQAVALFTNAISAAICEALNPLSEDPHLVWNYGVMAVLSFFGGAMFWWQFRSLDAEEDELNMLPEGHAVATLKDMEGYRDEPSRPPTPREIVEKN
ncbi:hypothetical protein V500_09682 [Pseudogymnoascus sp. VKM F-4518 (FW-2643)]|nr:hypothetical protein V500_09682 [Pseudogymnoascus sp. VKM F-4518 (FW-2643)]